MDGTVHKDEGARTHKRSLDQDTSDFPPSKSPHVSSSIRTHPSFYQGSFPFYRLPSELGCFSLDEKRCYHGDARRLRYLSSPTGMDSGGASLGWDLMEGFEDRYVRRDEDVKEGLLHILTWVKENRGLVQGNERSGSKRPVDRDFVTWRGHLTKILCAPYETQEGWILAVTLFKGSLYISERETATAYKRRKERTLDQEKLMYSGYRFESYMCADSPDGTPCPSEVVNTNEGYCSVMLGRLASHSFLVSGEVDCKDQNSANPSPPSCYVELKTSAQIRSQHQERSFHRYKLLKWWCQSFLLGIPLIVAGFRNQQGRIVSLEKFKTSEIPHLVRSDKQSWDPATCMNFCNAFLSYMKKVVTTDDPRVVYVFSWEPGQDVTYTVETNSDDPVVPDWYVRELSQMSGQ
ncbi:decapping and exoribonuclease protein-like isoform X1 [Hyla sarda]|uniref:decapping and exoribonuclease protein-like isoform X1 n=1 Tax=Hyla sarda TaxID=327740 RepID=UPI0024C26671|nr:decapping and exoribonuclease protein-like isoform X1 [Hyla sarda]